MGNCVFKGGLHNGVLEDMMVKVVTSNGGIMELYSPITVECITNEFPNHGIFCNGGQIYYLLPLNSTTPSSSPSSSKRTSQQQIMPEITSTTLAPYRMSTCEKIINNNGKMWWEPHEVFPRYNNTGVWKVNLVINPEKLSEILSQDLRIEALIQTSGRWQSATMVCFRHRPCRTPISAACAAAIGRVLCWVMIEEN